jgi:hypothetical protein
VATFVDAVGLKRLRNAIGSPAARALAFTCIAASTPRPVGLEM